MWFKAKNLIIITTPPVAYLFWTWDVTSIRQDKAAELVEVLYSPLFPLWGLQQHVCQKKISTLCNILLRRFKAVLTTTHQRLRFARQQ